MKKLVTLGLAAAAIAVTATASFAHHSFSMFDPSQEVVIEGTVARWVFSSPHTFLLVEDAEGTTWALEGAAPPSLLTRNPPMSGDTLQTGDPITVVQCPLRDGRAGGANGLMIAEDGTVYNPSDAGCRASRRSDQWPEWIEAGYRSLAEVEEAGLLEEEEMPADPEASEEGEAPAEEGEAPAEASE